MQRSRRAAACVAGVVLLGLGGGISPARAEGDPSPGSPEWVVRDAQNVEHSTGRWQDQYTSPAFGREATLGIVANFPNNVSDQIAHPDRPMLTLGQWIPGGDVGDPFRLHWHDELNRGIRADIEYRNRDGARITGHVWAPHFGAGQTFPGIVITTGSIQAPEEFYWWAAQGLAEAGYVVMTYDVQGQGESETFGHHPDGSLWCDTGSCPGVPAQQAANFTEGTEDALDFFLSDDNPLRGLVDASRLGLAGHSLGASAVSLVGNAATVYSQRASAQVTNPVDAVVAWDNAAAPPVPRVPTMGQNADYFLNPTPSPTAPDRDSKLGAYRAFKAAGIPTMQVALYGSTHLEWAYLPVLLPASVDGERVAFSDTRAWFDTFLKDDPSARARLTSPTFDGSADESAIGAGHYDPVAGRNIPYRIAGQSRADHLSIYYRSARFLGPGDPANCEDLKAGC